MRGFSEQKKTIPRFDGDKNESGGPQSMRNTNNSAPQAGGSPRARVKQRSEAKHVSTANHVSASTSTRSKKRRENEAGKSSALPSRIARGTPGPLHTHHHQADASGDTLYPLGDMPDFRFHRNCLTGASGDSFVPWESTS